MRKRSNSFKPRRGPLQWINHLKVSKNKPPRLTLKAKNSKLCNPCPLTKRNKTRKARISQIPRMLKANKLSMIALWEKVWTKMTICPWRLVMRALTSRQNTQQALLNSQRRRETTMRWVNLRLRAQCSSKWCQSLTLRLTRQTAPWPTCWFKTELPSMTTITWTIRLSHLPKAFKCQMPPSSISCRGRFALTKSWRKLTC